MRLLTAHSRGINRLAFSPDGSRLAAAGNGHGVAVWRCGHDAPADVWVGAGRTITALYFTPDGRSLLADGRLFGGGYGIVQFDVTTGRPLPGGFRDDRVSHLFRSASGDRFVCREARTLNRMVELGPVGGGPGWGVRRGVELLPQSARPLGLLNDGRVAVAPFDLTLDERNYVRQLDTRLVRVPAWGDRRVAPIPGDDRAALLGDGVLGVWRPTTGSVGGPVSVPGGRPTDVAVTPDGRSLLTTGTDGRVRVWDVDGPTERAVYDWQAGGLRACAVAPDGLTAAVATDRGKVIVFDLD